MSNNKEEKVDVIDRILFWFGISTVVAFCCFVAGFGYYIEEILPNIPT
jgi:hypothetical protein